MNLFSSGLTEQANQDSFARANPLKPDDLKAGFLSGVPTAAALGAGAVINDFARPLADAATPLLQPAAKSFDSMFKSDVSGYLTREQEKTHQAARDLVPNPATVGWVGQQVYGATNMIGDVVVGTMMAGGNPIAGAGIGSGAMGYKAFNAGREDGLDFNTSLGMGGIAAGSTFLGAFIPLTATTGMATGLMGRAMGAEVAGNAATAAALYGAAGVTATLATNLPAKLATAGAFNVATGIPTRGATSALLDANGYGEMAKQYEAFSMSEMISDFAVGSIFGLGVHGYQKWAERVPPAQMSDLDAVLALRNAAHTELGTAPGVPIDPVTRQAHIEAINQAIADLTAGRPVDVGKAVTEGEFLENPTAVLARTEVVRVVEDHMGPEWEGLQGELAARGLPTDTNLYQVTRTPADQMAPVRTTAEVSRMIERGQTEGWDTARFIDELETFKGKLEARNEANLEARAGDRVRGELWMRERLTRAERNGELSPEAVRLANWLIDKNPNIVGDLAISFKKAGDGNVAGEAGGYNPINRIVSLIKGRTNDVTVVHEILHHAERMMPEEVQAGIRAEWFKELRALTDVATRTQNPTLMQATADALRAANGDQAAFARLAEMISKGEVDERFYALANPSEFWAVNGSRILTERASESWVQQAKQWLLEFVEKIKGSFGLRSDAAVIRGLDDVIKGTGLFDNDNMLADGRVPRMRDIGSNFKRWFGNSKVVDAEGNPLVVYHGTRAENGITEFLLSSDGTFGAGIYFGTKGDANNYSERRAYDEAAGAIYPVFVSLQNPLRVKTSAKLGWGQAVVNALPAELRKGLTEQDDFGSDLKNAVEAAGHDGLIIEYAGGDLEVVAYRPEQIKSAIGNNGDFDPANPNILRQVVRVGSPQERAAAMLRKSSENENRTSIVVGARPGEFGWSFSEPDGSPPPIQHPVQRGPRLEKVGASVKKILTATGFQKLARDITGADKLEVVQIEGTWKGSQEPSFLIRGDNLTEESANRLAKLMGFAFAQDATVVTKHSPDLTEGIPTLYIGGQGLLQKSQLDVIIKAATERGLDLSTSADKKAVKFLHFGDEAELGKFMADVGDIAREAGLPAPLMVKTKGDLHEAAEYLNGEVRGDGQGDGLLSGAEGTPGLLGRVFDQLVVPYAKAIGAEGYRFSPERYAERFGLSDAQRDDLKQRLMPKDGESRSTVSLMNGEETLDIQPTTARAKGQFKANITDVMWALQNRAAQLGQIEPGDYSPKAMKTIAQAIAAEVIYHVGHSTKSAIGWYDAALKAAKAEYIKIFPEIAREPNKAMLFDAVLGITSQGNDVHSNSLFATRIFQLVKDGQVTLSEATQQLIGTFGNQTRAIELNLLKFEKLLDVNGYDRMRALFNQKMTVGEWNAILRKDTSLYGADGKPLSVEGAASQTVTGWMVFGPKIGSFINNLHGDYSTLTADLWFSRTWNRMLGYMFQHSPELEAKQYQEFRDALQAEFNQSTEGKTQGGKVVMKNGKPQPWENGKDVVGMDPADFDKLINDPDLMLGLAQQLEASYRKGGYKDKSDLRRRGKNWTESREETVAAPRSDLERDFQQSTVEQAQKMIKRKAGIDVTIADIQAALWFHEKELFAKMGASDARSAPADYADAATAAISAYRDGELFYVKANGEYIGGENGKYLGINIPAENGGEVPAVKALEQADADIATAKQDSQGYDAAVACALRG